ncbi:NAD(P)/FAD-dependent oxidoreductase [Parapedobacter soli]|uniref:NAD(P)/FAD-dependent oxidoreductase n=1 Tax=Parapedobacter soli TaxID=416955 RepID=UPI0021C8DA63|nr:NAD(P)/FAD-dependent oxidoreductase [Parapedobacter soli]
MEEEKKIVVIGGGFAGVNFAKHMANAPGFHVTLVDKNNYNFFPPLLYQVSTGFLDVSNISYPFRKLFYHRENIHFRLGELLKVDPELKKVQLSTGEMDYDVLVLATGTESNYFGIENIMKVAIPMKTVDDAINMRNTILLKMERATLATDEKELKSLTTIVITGGGPSGVEVSGMLAEMRTNIFKKDYPELANQKLEIYLVDGAPALLGPMSKQAQEYTLRKLTEMGVIVKLNKMVKDYVDGEVVFADGERIATQLLIWTAGVTSKVFEGIPKESYGRGRRLLVDEYGEVEGLKNVYAIGDTCLQTTDSNFPDGHPQLAQVAIQQGKNLADNLKAGFENQPAKPFTYRDKGSMAIIGRSKAVADLPKPKMHFDGFFAWLMWLFVHLFSLINFRNKIVTFYNWTVAFFTKNQSLRMIIRPESTQEQGEARH